MTVSKPQPLGYSALQLAWLQELGIEKPWLPGETALPKKPLTPPVVASKPSSAPNSVTTSVLATVPSSVPSLPPSSAPTAKVVNSESDVPTDTNAVAKAAADLESLAMTIGACRACGLCKERQQTVPGEGVMQPAIMVIGEAPSDLDDREGKPFLGRPGLMLDNMLASIQSSRTHNVYVSNIVKCRPPGNRNPKPEELAACKPYLMRQIELVRPFSILAVGRAAQSLLATDGRLDTLRQVTHTLTVAGQKIPLIATNHPIQLLNHPALKAAAWQDLQLVRTVSGL